MKMSLKMPSAKWRPICPGLNVLNNFDNICILHSGSHHWYRNTSPPGQSGRHFTDDTFSWMKNFVVWLKFHWSLFVRVQLTIPQHWFRWWLDTEWATSYYLNQCWPVSLTPYMRHYIWGDELIAWSPMLHICVGEFRHNFCAKTPPEPMLTTYQY